MNLSFRRAKQRQAPRHSAHGHRELTPAQAAAFADGLHGRPDTENDGLDVTDALNEYAPEPSAWTAAVPSHDAPGAQDAAMEADGWDPHATQPWTRPEDLQAARTRRYVEPVPAVPLSVLPAIPLDREIRLRVAAAITQGRFEDVEAYAAGAVRRATQRFDWVQARLARRLDAGWRACAAIAAAAAVRPQ